MSAPDRIVRVKTVLARTSLSRATMYRKIAEGTFPPQIRISAHGAGWRESDIDRWVADPVAWRPARSTSSMTEYKDGAMVEKHNGPFGPSPPGRRSFRAPA